MAVNYSTWTVTQLKKELDKIEKAIKAKEGREKKVVLAQLKAVAKKSGYSLDDLIGDSEAPAKSPRKKATSKIASKAASKANGKLNGKAKPVRKRAKAKVKFRNPKNKNEAWTGRGRQPLWIQAYLKSGGKMDDLAV